MCLSYKLVRINIKSFECTLIMVSLEYELLYSIPSLEQLVIFFNTAKNWCEDDDTLDGSGQG
jgi:hypothetical protein